MCLAVSESAWGARREAIARSSFLVAGFSMLAATMAARDEVAYERGLDALLVLHTAESGLSVQGRFALRGALEALPPRILGLCRETLIAVRPFVDAELLRRQGVLTGGWSYGGSALRGHTDASPNLRLFPVWEAAFPSETESPSYAHLAYNHRLQA